MLEHLEEVSLNDELFFSTIYAPTNYVVVVRLSPEITLAFGVNFPDHDCF